MNTKVVCGISGNILKIIAALSMFLDHMGLIFFPQIEWFRILGRIALPIFSFMIAEGCRYTRNKVRYFLTVFSLASICQLVYFLYNGDTYMSILITFSISIVTIYAMQFFKENLFDKSATILKKLFSTLLFLGVIVSVYFLNTLLEIDYGFFGCMLPVFAASLHSPKKTEISFAKKIDIIPVHLLMLSVGMLCLALQSDVRQFWAFLALPFLLLYSGKRGNLNIKYFFYIFYPTHLLLLEFINMLIQ